MELIINHTSVAEGSPTQIRVLDGATTIARVLKLFKEQTDATGTFRLRTPARQVLRMTQTLNEAGIHSGHVLFAFRKARHTPVTQALRRIERGITQQSYAHGEMMAQVGAVGTAVEVGFNRVEAGVGRVEERLERALAHVALEQSGDATPREQLTFLQNRRATDLNSIRLLRDSVRMGSR